MPNRKMKRSFQLKNIRIISVLLNTDQLIPNNFPSNLFLMSNRGKIIQNLLTFCIYYFKHFPF